VLAAQCAYSTDELVRGEPAASNLFEAGWETVARDSPQRL